MRIIVAISGASGTIYGVRLLSALKAAQVETDLIVTAAAQRVMLTETDYSLPGVVELATRYHDNRNLGASIASGQTQWDAMIVAPCSIKSLSSICYSNADSLLARAADTTLKERRKLVTLVRETPLHLGHLRMMTALTEMGGVVMPPVPTFYTKPNSLDDIVDNTVGRVLNLLGVENDLTKPWVGIAFED